MKSDMKSFQFTECANQCTKSKTTKPSKRTPHDRTVSKKFSIHLTRNLSAYPCDYIAGYSDKDLSNYSTISSSDSDDASLASAASSASTFTSVDELPLNRFSTDNSATAKEQVKHNLFKHNGPGSCAPAESVPYDHVSKRRVAMALVDLCTAYIESLWPNSPSRLPLRQFVFEILRRSRIQYPVFQVALCYMARLQPVVRGFREEGKVLPERLACGRRVLIAALQVASKVLQDHCYSAAVWGRISGLDRTTLVANEVALMQALGWKLHISSGAYLTSCQKLKVTVDQAFAERVYFPPPGLLTPQSSPPTTVLHEPHQEYEFL